MDRENELLKGIGAFEKKHLKRGELLDEYLRLQDELVSITFEGRHAAEGKLKIWDVENHLIEQSRKTNYQNEELLNEVTEGCKKLCNLIKAEISGNRGEEKAYQALKCIDKDIRILRNIELSDGNERCEIDFVVISDRKVTIVEVKNTSRNIVIDEKGNYYRGDYYVLDSNIAEKMKIREFLLRNALKNKGFSDVLIDMYVVFTNTQININNKFEGLKTCFVSQLPYIFEDKNMGLVTNYNSKIEVEKAIIESVDTGTFMADFNVDEFKRNFVKLVAQLEESSTKFNEKVDADECEFPDVDIARTNEKLLKTAIKERELRKEEIEKLLEENEAIHKQLEEERRAICEVIDKESGIRKCIYNLGTVIPFVALGALGVLVKAKLNNK